MLQTLLPSFIFHHMKLMAARIFLFTLVWFSNPPFSLAQGFEVNELDVIRYQVNLKPDIYSQSLEGQVTIDFMVGSQALKATFDCGSLVVDEVIGKSVKGFQQTGWKLELTFIENSGRAHSVRIFYHGSPTRGVVFSPKTNQVHTYFFSSEWMICNRQPSDRASIKMHITIEDSLTAISTGELIKVKTGVGNSLIYTWDQQVATPAYTYGFVIGNFNKVQLRRQGITYNFYSNKYHVKQLDTIFRTTHDMATFFQEKSGVPYFQDTYSQVLIGNQYQEMSGFAILKQSYGNLVLNDSTETNLIGHELAHQWWGNMITCKNWNHFWLNEAFATFMSAAYNEHRFGKEKYHQNIQEYFEVYQAIRNRGGDKPLIFEDWSNPTRDDRNLVYFKGAYVLHLLRKEMGESNYWKGIKHYSQQNFGKSVLTKDFQESMESSSGTDLKVFFDKWIYLRE